MEGNDTKLIVVPMHPTPDFFSGFGDNGAVGSIARYGAIKEYYSCLTAYYKSCVGGSGYAGADGGSNDAVVVELFGDEFDSNGECIDGYVGSDGVRGGVDAHTNGVSYVRVTGCRNDGGGKCISLRGERRFISDNRRASGKVDATNSTVIGCESRGSTSESDSVRSDSDCDKKIVESGSEIVPDSTLANRAKRAKRKARKLRKQGQSGFVSEDNVPEWRRKFGSFGANQSSYRGAFGECSADVRRKLADTRAERLIAENLAASVKAKSVVDNWEVNQKLREKRNNLKALQVSQTIELVRSQDVDKLKKRQEVQVMRDTEVSKVQVERAFGTLANSGNIPAAVGGSAQTIVSGTISPNSSVSEQEVRAMQKKCLDQEKQIVELVARLREAKVDDIRNGTYSVGITVDSDGEPIGDLGDAYCGYIGKDGRFHQGENYDLW